MALWNSKYHFLIKPQNSNELIHIFLCPLIDQVKQLFFFPMKWLLQFLKFFCHFYLATGIYTIVICFMYISLQHHIHHLSAWFPLPVSKGAILGTSLSCNLSSIHMYVQLYSLWFIATMQFFLPTSSFGNKQWSLISSLFR